MSETAIRVVALGKEYRLGQLREQDTTLREALASGTRGLLARLGSGRRRRSSAGDGRIWALRHVSMEVQRGDIVGIIGRNGAGKSTLLKILSRVTEPTIGHAEIHGRVGSLLEVGTGFHPDLTGRENIYLNGAILGMRRSEINRQFDDIVSFAEVEKFIDTPVKRYSSGMYLRLAFAVAAHLEPEILLVDEVLAVGDAVFQRKCLGKMSDVAKEGRTILFVSHNVDAVRRLCSRTVLLERGEVVADGESAVVVARYLSGKQGDSAPNQWIDVSRVDRTGTGAARFVAARYSGGNGGVADHPYPDGPLDVALVIESDSVRSIRSLAVTVRDQFGVMLINADIVSLGETVSLREGRNAIGLRIEQIHLNAGRYVIGLWLGDTVGKPYDHVDAAFELKVVATQSLQFGLTPISNGLVPCRFSILRDI